MKLAIKHKELNRIFTPYRESHIIGALVQVVDPDGIEKKYCKVCTALLPSEVLCYRPYFALVDVEIIRRDAMSDQDRFIMPTAQACSS